MTRTRERGPAADVRFFSTPAGLRRWFAKQHGSEEVLWVGFYRRDSGEPMWKLETPVGHWFFSRPVPLELRSTSD